jgi:hypothetical protein
MGNTCSKTTTQPDSIRVQEDNYPTSIWNYNPVPNNDDLKQNEDSSLYCQIYLASFYNTKSGSFCGHLFLMKYHDVVDEEEQVVHRYSFLFFEFVSKPRRITIEKKTDGNLKISFIDNVDTVLFEQVWIPSEYVMEDSGSLKSIVKKKMIDGVSSDIPMIDESAQEASTTSGGNASSASEDVSPSNGSQTNGSAEVHSAQRVPSVVFESDIVAGASALQTDVQRLSVNSHDNGSATLAPEVFESDNGAGASALQANVQQLSVDSHDDGSATHATVFVSSDNDAGASGLRVNVQPHQTFAQHILPFVFKNDIVAEASALQANVRPPQTAGHSSVNSRPYKFEKDFREMLNKLEIYYNMLKSIQLNGGVKYHQQYFPQCNFCIIRSAKNHRKTLYDDSVSDSISPRVIQSNVIDISINFSVNCVPVSLILTVPKDVIIEIANFRHVNGEDVLSNVSLLFNQYVALLQLDYKPSKTALVLSDAVCDNSHKFILRFCHQMRLIISRLERRASSENATADFEIVKYDNRIAPCVDASSAVKDVNRRQEFARCGPVEESTTGGNIKTVKRFSGRQYRFTVSDDSKSIVYTRLDWNSPCNIENDVQFGITNISSLTVYELLTGVYLIVIQTKFGQTYLSGYLSTNATQVFTTFQITSNLEERRFQSFEHVSGTGTVFKCLFSDNTERTFSIEYDSYAKIKELLDA